MNPLARGIHKNVESKSYQSVSNDIQNETIEASDPQQRRSRLGRLKQAISKPLGSSSNTTKVTDNDSEKASPPTWNGEFPTEVIAQNVEKPYRNDVRTAISKSGGVSILSYADSSDIVVEPTISRPSIQQRQHSTNHGMKGSATVTSYLSVESLDHVEPPSVSTISRPSMKMQQQHPTIQSLKGSSTLHSQKSLHNADYLERPSNSSIGRHSIHQGQVVTNPNLKGSATVFSSQTIESVDHVERPSITTPSFHRGQANRMSSSKRMLSEKTINTINTQGTFNTYGTSGTENYTITTVGSTAPGSFVSLQSTTTASLAAALAHTADDSGYCDATDGYEYEMSLSDENSPSCRLSQANQETEEDLMIRMAMEMSLAEFKANGGKDSHHLQHDFPEDRFPVRNKGMQWNRQSSLQSVMTSITTEPTEVFIENNAGSQRNRVFTFSPSNEKPLLTWSSEGDTVDFTHSLDTETLRQLEFARANLPKEEADAIESAIRNSYSGEVATKKHEVTSLSQPVEESPLSVNASEAAEIEQAIKDADEHQERLSMEVAIKLQAAEEKDNFQRNENQSYDISIDNGFHQDFKTTSGSNSLFASLTCQDEITEHDLDFNLFKSEWGDTILNFEADEDIDFADNSAYDVFKTNFHRPARAPSATENRTRDQIHQAIDTGLIGNCNGIVKKGDEAVVYHANEGAGSDGHDVAIKVFQRIKRIRSRTVGEGALCYFPRSFRDSFRDDESFTPEQLELLAEKEYANLIRAHHARVPVASPLLQQENLVFMRFMGEDGWPAPQLKDMELRVGSKTWSTLYFQVMVAIRRLYTVAQLVHADLSEHNILVCSPDYVEHSDKNTTGEGENFQIVLIDFVQAVDINHPKAQEYLERDMDQLRHFFTKKGIKALGKGMAVLFVTGSDKILPDQATTTSNSQDFPRKSNDETAYVLKKLRSVNSVSSKSTQSSGSRVNSNGIKGKHKISARSMSTTSVSTKSSMSSMCPMSPVKSHTVNQDQSSSASLVTSQECLIESSTQKTSKKEKKEKKSKKEKKEKKKKRDKLKDSSSKTCKSNDDYQKRQIFDQNTLSSSMDFRNPGEVTEIVTSMDNNVQDHHITDHPLFPATFEASDIFSENMPDLNDTRWEQTWNSKFEE